MERLGVNCNILILNVSGFAGVAVQWTISLVIILIATIAIAR